MFTGKLSAVCVMALFLRRPDRPCRSGHDGALKRPPDPVQIFLLAQLVVQGWIMADAHYQVAADVLTGWRDDVLSGAPLKLFPVGTGELARLEVGPGLVTLLGGAPGAGKTAFSMQCLVDALRLTPSLRAVVCNVEMPPNTLLDRQLARLSGVALSTIRYRKLGAEHADRIDQAIHTLEPLAERLAFCRQPFDLANVAATADAFHAELLLLDYIQRIPPPGEHGDRRGAIDRTMDYLRQFADAGVAVICVAAVARGKDRRGRSTYASDALSLASFRESSELEFGADDAFILVADQEDTDAVSLRHLKARYSEGRDMDLHFDRPLQRFTPVAADLAPAERGKLQSTLRTLWERTAPARDDDQGDDDLGG
jgi:replicative DNA helicase